MKILKILGFILFILVMIYASFDQFYGTTH